MRANQNAAMLAMLCSKIYVPGFPQVIAPGNGSISEKVTGKDGFPLDRVRVTAKAVPAAGMNDLGAAVLVTLAQTVSWFIRTEMEVRAQFLHHRSDPKPF
jgi:hypothetical protein